MPRNGRRASLGIDNVYVYIVARVLVLLLTFQPVYVAFGAELDEHTADDQISTEDSQETTAISDDSGATDDAPDNTEDENALDVSNEHDQVASVADTVESDAQEDSDIPVYEEQENDGSETEDGSAAEEGMVNEDASGLEDDGDEDASVVAEEGDTGTYAAEDTEGDVSGEGFDDVSDVDTSSGDVSGDEQSEGGDGEDVITDEDQGADDTEDTVAGTDTTEPEEEASSTEDIELPAVTKDSSNKYTFGEGDCTLVAEGQFYCVAPTTERYAVGDPRVYAEKDREGDREIYYFDGVEVHRITNNSYDDFAPSFDETTKRIVWQANIQDRMQIMLHDLETGTTRQITNARENSSNPHILGNRVVWQQWVDTNWEIMMADIGADGTFDIEQLTDNAVHDMFPQLYKGLVTWQREKGSSWQVIVYDLRTGEEHALEKSDDTKYENPRFVLLFDSRHDNGDVETIGYDLDTGEMMELGTKAAPIPANPVTPKDKVPDAPVTTGTSTALKMKDGGDDGEDDTAGAV